MSRLFESPSEKPSASLATREVTRDATTPAAEFSTEQRRILLRIAHGAFLSALERRPFPEAPPLSPGLSDPRGVFTTLYLHNDVHGDLHRQLRGCVGYAVPIAPLFRAVAETARAAAFEDSRVLPVTMEEALPLEVSLSVLPRLFPLYLEAVEGGRYGLVNSEVARPSLLLAHVAFQNGCN